MSVHLSPVALLVALTNSSSSNLVLLYYFLVRFWLTHVEVPPSVFSHLYEVGIVISVDYFEWIGLIWFILNLHTPVFIWFLRTKSYFSLPLANLSFTIEMRMYSKVSQKSCFTARCWLIVWGYNAVKCLALQSDKIKVLHLAALCEFFVHQYQFIQLINKHQ